MSSLMTPGRLALASLVVLLTLTARAYGAGG